MLEPFTAQSLRPVLEGILSRRQRMPGDSEIERLAGVLNYWARYYASVTADDADRLLDQEGTGLKLLAIALPRLRAKIAAELAFLREVKALGNVAAAREKRLAEIDGLWAAARTAMQPRFWNLFWEHHGTNDGPRWHQIQNAICEDFITAMRPNNPTETFGLTEKGVLARFVSAVVPQITGECVKVASVGQHRKKAARRRHP